jgi:hypothetical protein
MSRVVIRDYYGFSTINNTDFPARLAVFLFRNFQLLAFYMGGICMAIILKWKLE